VSTWALLSALVAACAAETSGARDEDDGASAGISITGSAPTTEGGGTEADAGSEDSGAPSTADPPGSSGDEGVKFDLGAEDTGSAGCAGDGDGGGAPSFSFIWIANTTEGTVSKIDTLTGIEAGRYRTSAAGSDSPSRTSVNQFGDVLVANRVGAGAATKIAAIMERCLEKNGVPGIQTSTGAADVLPYLEDECVLWSTPMPISDYGPRGIAWEGGEIDLETCQNTVPNPRVWVSFGGNPEEIYRLDGASGAVIDHVSHPAGGGRIYGGAVNAQGDLWYVNRGTNRLARIDAVTLMREEWTIPNVPYGMGVDANGDPWVVSYNGGAGVDRVYRFDVASLTFIDAGGTGGYYRGMNVDRDGKVWVGGNNPCRLAVFDGTTDTLINDAIPLPGCTTPVGVSIDFEGYVWVVDQNGTAYKVNPTDYSILLMATGLVGPYTYSDMTGAGLDLVLNPPG
jgi:hypothetical protein